MSDLDNQIFYFLFQFAHRNIYLDKIIVLLAEYLPLIIILIALTATYHALITKKKGRHLKYPLALLSGIISFGIVYLFQYFYHHERPFLHLDLVPLFNLSTNSFPSMHAAGLFALSSAVYFTDIKLGWVLLILSAIVGIARISAGVHYPSDVLAGAVLGILISYIIFKNYKNE